MLGKKPTFLSQADAARIAPGAHVLIILTSQADATRIPLISCVMVAPFADARRGTPADQSS